jgi:tetratricopeptide (TPR) repeat protein
MYNRDRGGHVRALVMLPIVLTMATAAGQAPPEATSLLGKPLVSAPAAEAVRQRNEENLAAAKTAYDNNPASAEAIIWLGRRTAYLGRFRDAIAIFSQGIERHPGDARMYRHRGHRYLTVRELDRAIADLTRAAALVKDRPDEVEPDGQPNARNIPTSTLNTNIYYHLGLAHYLRGDFAPALQAYRECLRYAKNADMQVATSHWLYMTLRRLDRAGEAAAVLAPISTNMDIIENGSYYKLLMFYKGSESEERLLSGTAGLDAVTIGYGVGNWHYYGGRPGQARKIFAAIVEANASEWPAFGYLAAEAELARAR